MTVWTKNNREVLPGYFLLPIYIHRHLTKIFLLNQFK